MKVLAFRLLNCYVEDTAIEDTIYYLGQALKSGKLDLESYLKVSDGLFDLDGFLLGQLLCVICEGGIKGRTLQQRARPMRVIWVGYLPEYHIFWS